MSKALEEIKDVIERGLRNDIFRAERAISVNQEIAKYSDEINKSDKHKKRILAYLQNLTINEAILATTKLYDKVGSYPTRSIHLLLKLLNEKAEDLPEVGQKPNVRKLLHQLKVPDYIIGKVDSQDPSQFPKYCFQYYYSLVYDPEIEELLEKVKSYRDKRIAHNERTKESLGFKWKSVKRLLELPKQLVGILGWAYFDTVYMHNNRYNLTFDAHKLTASVRGLIDLPIEKLR